MSGACSAAHDHPDKAEIDCENIAYKMFHSEGVIVLKSVQKEINDLTAFHCVLSLCLSVSLFCLCSITRWL